MLRVSIDGSPREFAEGLTILQALRLCGREVPHLCDDSRLQPAGVCRLCVVEVEEEARPVPSCATLLAEGMVIRTTSPALEALRHTNLQLMASTYPAEAMAREPDHPFHRLLARYGITPAGEKAARIFQDDSHPYLGMDMERCIHCYRCVRICDEVQGQFVWKVWDRGEQTHVAVASGTTLLDSGCTACGACADSCPTSALFDKRSPDKVEQWTRSTCVYCGVGCQMEVGSHDGKVVAIRPAGSPVNRGHLCSKGRYAFEFAQAPDRITTPMLRRGNAWQAVSWDEALEFTAARLRDILACDGADSMGVLGSARATNEENYLAQKFARVVLGTNNVDCCARVCHTPSAKALKTMLGAGAATNAFDDIELAQTFLLCGCNPTESHPIVGARIKQAVLKGARLIVVDPRRTELTDYADLHLAVRPGHNIELFNAMAAAIVEEGLLDDAFITDRVDDLAAFTAFIRDYAPEQVAARCGVSASDIRAAARLYATAKPAMCFHGLGVTEHIQGTEGVMTLINLALLTGNLGCRGGGINPLRGQNNVQGAAHMGCDPAVLPGSAPFTEAVCKRFEQAWGIRPPSKHGLNLMAMMDAAAEGQLKALWAIGYDIYLTLANAEHTARALRQLDLLIVQDLFLNETARAFGTVFFPAASVFEKDGTFMNSDRRVQRVRQAVAPVGDARPDWWIIQELAKRMGHAQGFCFTAPATIWDEVRNLWPDGAGLSYTRLETESLNWPCPDEQHPGTPVLHVDRFISGPRTALACIPFIASPEQCDDNFPLLLITGRRLYHFNAGTMSYRTPNAELQPAEMLDMAPTDASRLELHDGDRVLVSSRYGSLTLPIRVSANMRPGEVFTAFHHPGLFVNRLTSPYRDRQVHTPEFKITAVRVEKARSG